jgi:serine/threonine protein kinase
MAGGSLQDMIEGERKRNAPRGWDWTRKYIALYGTAIGMMILHKNRIIHRDLKPANVLLTATFEAKVADFGMSKYVDRGATLKQTGQYGTPLYMAPEIFEGYEYAFPVDVYAFAILAYVCITLQPPFTQVKSTWMLGNKVMKGERPKIPKWIPEKWKTLIEKCWAQNPNDRPTFEKIVEMMGKADFMDEGIDKDAVIAYQRRVLPASQQRL